MMFVPALFSSCTELLEITDDDIYINFDNYAKCISLSLATLIVLSVNFAYLTTLNEKYKKYNGRVTIIVTVAVIVGSAVGANILHLTFSLLSTEIVTYVLSGVAGVLVFLMFSWQLFTAFQVSRKASIRDAANTRSTKQLVMYSGIGVVFYLYWIIENTL